MSGLRAALRMARRDAARAKVRSALVVAMIALPVLGVGAADVLWRTFELSADQRATRQMGAADAVLEDSGMARVVQDATGNVDSRAPRSGRAPTPASVLPPGSRTLVMSSAPARLRAGELTAEAELRALAYQDPLAAGLFRQSSGRAPSASHEVALTRALATRLGVSAGDHVVLKDRRLSVVGVVDDGSQTDAQTALITPDAAPPGASRSLLVGSSRPLTWSDVTRANAAGFVLRPRAELPGTPPPPYDTEDSLDASALTAVTLVVGMVLLEIVLLAGPAFAVGAKRQTRELALLAATGAERRDIRRTVLGGGLVLGAVGGLLGVLAAIGLAKLAVPRLTALGGDVPGPFDVRPLELGGLVLLGATTAVLAAVLPARVAAQQDVVAALTGRRGQVRSLRRTPVLGAVAAVLGALIALHGARQRDINVILAGSMLAELGLVATTPFLVGQVGRLSPWLPLGPRLALRDAARNRGRTAPAVSAVLAAVAGSVAIGTYVASLDQYDREAYQPSAARGAVTVPLFASGVDGSTPSASGVAAVLRRHLPGSEVRVVRGFRDDDGSGPRLDVTRPTVIPCSVLAGRAHTRAELLAAERDPACQSGSQVNAFPASWLVGGPELLRVLTGERLPEQEQVLASGGVVVPPQAVDAAGRALLRVMSAPPVQEGEGQQIPPEGEGTVLRTAEVPAVALPRGALQVSVISPQAAERVRLAVRDVGVVALGEQPPSKRVEDQVSGALEGLGISYVQVERGYVSEYDLGLLALVLGSAVIVLGASGIATGLAAADGRADLSTLAAIGASPGTRRSLAAFQSAVTAGLGTLLGVAAGLVPAIGMVRALNAAAMDAPFPRLDPYPLVLPWTNLAVTVLVVPLVAAGAAALLTRSRLPLVRRIA